MLSDARIRTYIETTNTELLQVGQEIVQIKEILTKANLFMLNNIWIFENLIATLKDE